MSSGYLKAQWLSYIIQINTAADVLKDEVLLTSLQLLLLLQGPCRDSHHGMDMQA